MDAKELLKKIEETAVNEARGKKFEIPVNIVFSGTVTIKANSKAEAEEIALNDFGAILDRCEDNMNSNIVDWDMDTHGYAELKGE